MKWIDKLLVKLGLKRPPVKKRKYVRKGKPAAPVEAPAFPSIKE